MADREVAPELDPLFVGLTYPPMMLGVPMLFFGINFMLFGIGIIALPGLFQKLLFFVFVNLTAHGAAYVATNKDAHWMNVYATMMNKCGPSRNQKFWKSKSLMP